LRTREETYLLPNILSISSFIPKNAEGEHSFLSSTPLYDSSDHEYADEHTKLSNCGCRDHFSPPFDQDVDSFSVELYKPSILEDLLVREVKTPRDVKALQLDLMVIAGHHYIEVDSTQNKKSIETPKVLHHSLVYIKYQSS